MFYNVYAYIHSIYIYTCIYIIIHIRIVYIYICYISTYFTYCIYTYTYCVYYIYTHIYQNYSKFIHTHYVSCIILDDREMQPCDPKDSCCSQADRKPPAKKSPAPVLSTTSQGVKDATSFSWHRRYSIHFQKSTEDTNTIRYSLAIQQYST